jgi:hypothetical protein
LAKESFSHHRIRDEKLWIEDKKIFIAIGLAIESSWSPHEWRSKQFGHHKIGN